MLVPNRHGSTPAYRYGFNGKEKDDELKGEGNSINYEARMQDTRIGRFLSIDPLTKSFPHYSPYQFAGNTPIQAIDLDGAEEYHYLAKWDKESGKIIFKLESEKTVHRKSYFGYYPYIPTEEHIVVYQNDNGETSTYEFPKGGKLVQYGPTSIAERINTPASLKKFASDAKNIYQDEESAERALATSFLSNSAEDNFSFANATIVANQFYTPQTKATALEKNAPKIKKVDDNGGEVIKTSKEYITVKKGNTTYHINDTRVKEYVENPKNPKSNQGGDAVDFKKNGVPAGSKRITGEKSGKGHKRTPTSAELKMFNEKKLN